MRPARRGRRQDPRAQRAARASTAALKLTELARRIGIGTLLLVTLPFVLVVGSMVQRTLWFKLGAERAVGRVVETSGGDAPSITVEYLVRDGRVLRTVSDGSLGYRSISRGVAITVFYDAGQPEYARIDLFLENWLQPILVGIVGGMVIGAMAFIVAQFRQW